MNKTGICFLVSAVIVKTMAAQISTEAVSGVFVDGQTPSFKVEAAPGSVWQATDWRGKTIGKGTVGEVVTPPAPDRGYYELEIREPDGKTARHSYLMVPDPKTRKMDQQSFYSVDAAFSGLGHRGRFACPWFGGDSLKMMVELHRLAGIPHTRERMQWKVVQRKRDAKPNFAGNLENDAMLKAAGVSVSGLYHDSPDWADRQFSLPGDLVATYRFAEACAREFGDTVEDWEFWNEEDGGHSPEPAWEFSSAFKAASLGFKAGRREVLVLQGALCRPERSAYDELLFANDIGKYLDVFNYHSYAPLCDYEKVMKELRAFLDKHDRKKRAIWITENGTNSEGHCDDDGAMDGLKKHAPWQERLLAEFYPKSQAMLQMLGINRSYFFVFSAYNERGGTKDWGVLRRDGTLKPIFAAMSTMTDELVSAKIEGEVDIGGDARAYLFRQPNGTQTLIAWRKSQLEKIAGQVSDLSAPKKNYTIGVKEGDYCVVDMCGARKAVHAGEKGLTLELDRYPVYVRNVKGLKVARAAMDAGNIGPVAAENEDLSIVLQAFYDRKDFAAGSGQASILLDKQSGKLTIKAWNLSETPKKGKITVKNATVSGLEQEIEIPAFGMVKLPVVFINDEKFMDNPEGALVEFGGVFNGKPISKMVLRIVDTMRAIANSTRFDLATDEPKNWQKNTSAKDFKCVKNEKEGGVIMEASWESAKCGRWLYPRYVMRPNESAEGARIFEFEVRSTQNKVENDYSLSVLMLGFDGTDNGKWLKFEPPREVWETRRFNIGPVLKKHPGEKLTSFRIGGHPLGTEIKYYIRNVRFYIDKNTPLRKGEGF